MLSISFLHSLRIINHALTVQNSQRYDVFLWQAGTRKLAQTLRCISNANIIIVFKLCKFLYSNHLIQQNNYSFTLKLAV